ncbi:MAG: hypothetical protein R3C26_07550 [Calditrichia bacterium]
MGFKVMLWVCPFVSPDSPVYREISEKGYLLRENTDAGEPGNDSLVERRECRHRFYQSGS